MKLLVCGALASIAMFAPASSTAQAKPVVAVLYFENNSYGKDAADYANAGKGLAEMVTYELLQNQSVQVVERERVQALLMEQNLIRQGSIDPQTAVRLGKILGAQYMITGAFMHDGRGTFTLTGRAINVETTAISNPQRVQSKGDDVLGMINTFATKMSSEMRLPVLRVGDASSGTAIPAGQPVTSAASQPAASSQPAPSSSAAQPAKQDAHAGHDAKPATAAQPSRAAQPKARKMDMKTAMLFAKALEQDDAGNRSAAIELYQQVNAKFPDYAPVARRLSALNRG